MRVASNFWPPKTVDRVHSSIRSNVVTPFSSPLTFSWTFLFQVGINACSCWKFHAVHKNCFNFQLLIRNNLFWRAMYWIDRADIHEALCVTLLALRFQEWNWASASQFYHSLGISTCIYFLGLRPAFEHTVLLHFFSFNGRKDVTYSLVDQLNFQMDWC